MGFTSNVKDFHLPIKSRNFVLTIFHDGARAPSSVSFLVGFGQEPSQPKDRYRLYRDFRTQIPSVPVYLFEILFRHEVLHGERAASTYQPIFRYARRERLPRVSACITPHKVPQSSLGGSDDPCLSLNENSCFVQRLRVPFILILNGLPLSVPGTLFPRLQLLDCSCSECKTLLPLIKFWYIFCIPQTRPNRRKACCSHQRENKNRLEIGDRSGNI